MEHGYLLFSMQTTSGTDDLTVQCYSANTEDGENRLRAGLKDLRERLGMGRLELGKQGDTGTWGGARDKPSRR